MHSERNCIDVSNGKLSTFRKEGVETSESGAYRTVGWILNQRTKVIIERCTGRQISMQRILHDQVHLAGCTRVIERRPTLKNERLYDGGLMCRWRCQFQARA